MANVRKNYLFCIDDVDATASSGSVQTSQFIKFFSEHKSWLHGDSVTEYKNQVIATTRTSGRGCDSVNFDAVHLSVDEIDRQDLISMFKRELKEKFLAFELDIQFLITKVIMASVDINKTFTDSNAQRGALYFHIQVELFQTSLL